MSLPTCGIAYTTEDQSAAARMVAGVGPGVEFRHFVVARATAGTVLADEVSGYDGYLILLVSDTFLKNPNCMLRLDEIFGEGRDVLPVIITAHRPDATSGEIISVETRLNDRSDVQHYVSYWEDRYIELRRGADDLGAADQEAFQRYFRRIRDISTKVEDYLNLLREQWTLTDAQFSADDYKQLYLFMGIPQPNQNAKEPDPAPNGPPYGEEGAGGQGASAQDWIRRAWAMSDAGDTPGGLELLEAGREVMPEQPELHYQYALMLALGADDMAASRREVEELLERNPNHHGGLFLSGELHFAAGEWTEARDDWEQLADLEPLYPDLNQRLGVLLLDRFPDEDVEAADYLGRAARHEDPPAEVLYRYALLLSEKLDRPKKAMKMLRRAVSANPEHAAAQYQLAVMLHARGEIEAARSAFRLAISSEPAYDTPTNRRAFRMSAPYPAEGPTLDTSEEMEKLAAIQRSLAELEASIVAKQEATPASAPKPGDGKTVLVTGATSGIGRATARRLAADGFRLLLLGRREERLGELADELIFDHDTDCHWVSLDVRDREAVGELVNDLPEDWRAIDVLINNAGKAKGFDPIHEGDLDHWEEMIDVNLKGLLYLTRAVSPGMVERGEGFIVNVASTAGKEVYPSGNVYCATKHAVDALTYAMRLDLVKHGVRVGQVCPAHVEETEFALVRFDGDAERAKIYEDFQPLRAADVAETIHFMITQPRHVNILDVVLQGTQQASSTVVDRSGRDRYTEEE